MACQTDVTGMKLSLNSFPVPTLISCPLQILVIDRVTGPAGVLADTVSRLLPVEVSVTSVDDHTDALRALHACGFDFVLVGMEDDPFQLTIVPYLRAQNAELPVFVVGKRLSWTHEQHARRYGAQDVLRLPGSASELKALVARLTEEYLEVA